MTSTDAFTALLSDEQVEQRYGIRAGTLRAWRSRRTGPPWVQVSKRMPRYRVADIEAYLAERVTSPGGVR